MEIFVSLFFFLDPEIEVFPLLDKLIFKIEVYILYGLYNNVNDYVHKIHLPKEVLN